MVPAGWGMPFWLNLVFRGARVGGQHQLDQLHLEQQRFRTLADAPDTRAGAEEQVWSLSSFEVSRQLLMNDLNKVLFVSLLMTSPTTLAKEGLFELTRHPLLTLPVSLSFAETTEEQGCSQVKKLKFDGI